MVRKRDRSLKLAYLVAESVGNLTELNVDELSVRYALPAAPGARPVTTPKSDTGLLRHSSGKRWYMTGSYSRAPASAVSSDESGA